MPYSGTCRLAECAGERWPSACACCELLEAAVPIHLLTPGLRCRQFSPALQTKRPNLGLLFKTQKLNAQSPKEAKDLEIAAC